MKSYPLAAQVYAFLAEHIDESAGAVVVSQELLAEELGVHERTIRRATAWLDEQNIIGRIKLGGAAVYAYCLDPEEVWKSFDDAKDYAAFRTKTLARKRDNGDIKRKLKVMLTGQRDLLEDNGENEPLRGE
jgi:DNA-binding GntR family transcriptional regulator